MRESKDHLLQGPLLLFLDQPSTALHIRPVDVLRGQYKVRAVDYWGRTGPFSDVLII
jgi:hypothetical protein